LLIVYAAIASDHYILVLVQLAKPSIKLPVMPSSLI